MLKNSRLFWGITWEYRDDESIGDLANEDARAMP
jgi:hypothetical protein